MGQQQLLLIVLGAIIVGIAVVVGINMMGSAADQANIDAVRQDVLNIASNAQQWYQKPVMMGGGGRSFQDNGNGDISFEAIAFSDSVSTNGLTAFNENGEFTISNPAQNSFDIAAFAPTADTTLNATITPDGVTWTDAGGS